MLSKTSQCFKYINNNYGRNYYITRCYSFFKHMKEVKDFEEKGPVDPNEPIKFSTSPAAKFNIKHIRLEHDIITDASWAKIFIWSVGILSTVYYLLYYRQGNDIDDQLAMPLGKRVLQLREQTVREERNQAILQGRPTTSQDAKLEEIRRLREKYNYDDD